jgi:hypothetical protein
MKRVLIVAYHFPPLGTGGVGRALGWARHLQSSGWMPTILAATPNRGWPTDHTLLQQVPDTVAVTRVLPWDPRPDPPPGLNRRELTFLWRPPAIRAGRLMLAEKPHDLILSTAPPPVAHGVASALAREFEIPWVADFRDPWALGAPTLWRKFRRSQLVQSAADVVAVNEHLKNHLEKSFRRHVHTVFNGFEPDEIPNTVATVPRSVVLLGTLSDFNDLDTLFRVLAHLNGEFIHIGVSRRFDLKARAAAAGLRQVRSAGYLSRADALRESAKGSVMLLSLAKEEHLTLPTKMFDYMGLRKPVLCLGEDGATADFIKSIPGLGLSVKACDASAIKVALEALWSQDSCISATHSEPFTRAHQSRHMARIMNDVIGHES